MPEEKNGQNGGKVGLVDKVKDQLASDVQSLKTDMPAKVKEQMDGLKDPTKTQVYTSIFRHKHDETPRNRALGVLSNVFLHLHPAKINRDAVALQLHLGHGRNHVLPLYRAHLHRRVADVLLPPHQGAGFPRRALSRARCSVRQATAQHASLGAPT